MAGALVLCHRSFRCVILSAQEYAGSKFWQATTTASATSNAPNDPLAGIERDCHAEQDRDNKQCNYPGREPDAARFPSPGPRVALPR